MVNSSQGGGSKDTWVLAREPALRRLGSGRVSPVPDVIPHDVSTRDPAPGRRWRSHAMKIRRDMLSRIAESLFWIGRYVERADDTARILDAFLAGSWKTHGWMRTLPAGRCWPSSGPRPRPRARIAGGDVLELHGLRPGQPKLNRGCARAARENARGARETISSEMWEA